MIFSRCVCLVYLLLGPFLLSQGKSSAGVAALGFAARPCRRVPFDEAADEPIYLFLAAVQKHTLIVSYIVYCCCVVVVVCLFVSLIRCFFVVVCYLFVVVIVAGSVVVFTGVHIRSCSTALPDESS